MPDNHDCTFLYFKPSGKWAYEGRGRFPKYSGKGYHEVNRQTIIAENNGMPGVIDDARNLIVVVLPDDDHPCQTAFPRMLHPIDAE